MNNDKISVAIIGGGETGTPLLRQFLDVDFVEVMGVADLDTTAPGMQIAMEHGIATTTDFMDLVRENEALDVVIDVTGVNQVRTSLREHLDKTGNRHTVVMNEVIVCLIMSLSHGRLTKLKHGEQGY